MNAWTSAVLVVSLFAVALHATSDGKTTTTTTKKTTTTTTMCPDGSFVYGASCYWFERHQSFTWLEAKEFCAKRGATMWVPNCIDEWNAIRHHTTFIKWTWLGAQAITDDHKHVELAWNKGEEGISERDLPWMMKTDTHGYVGETKCVAYANRHDDASQKVSFYMCDSPKYHVMCEKNATIVEPVPAPALPCYNVKTTETQTKKETTVKSDETVKNPDTTTTVKTDETVKNPDTTTTVKTEETMKKPDGTTTVKKEETVKTEDTAKKSNATTTAA